MKIILPRCSICKSTDCRQCYACGKYTCTDCVVWTPDGCVHERNTSEFPGTWEPEKQKK